MTSGGFEIATRIPLPTAVIVAAFQAAITIVLRYTTPRVYAADRVQPTTIIFMIWAQVARNKVTTRVLVIQIEVRKEGYLLAPILTRHELLTYDRV